MKSKGSSSLYEVLKSASRPQEPDGAPAPSTEPAASPSEGGQQTLQERLAAYKAARLAAVGSSSPEPAPAAAATAVLPEPAPAPEVRPAPVCVAPPPPPPATRAPEPEPVSEEIPLPAAPARGPGERVIRVTYNTALFGGLVVAGLLFIAYAIGLHSGKSDAPAPAPQALPDVVIRTPAPIVAVPPPPPPVRKEYTIRLGEWKYGTSQERLKANALAEDLKKALDRAGHRGVEKTFIPRGAEVRMALYIDRFTDVGSEAARAKLAALKAFKFQNLAVFAQAAFEEISQR